MKILAKVQFNNSFALVFDKKPIMLYREITVEGNRYLEGFCGPFRSYLQYQRDGYAKAFAGREFTLRMASGETRIIKDVWWDCANPYKNTVSITYSTIEELRECYVYTGGMVKKEVLDEMLLEYNNRTRKNSLGQDVPNGGFFYRYYEYEKIIKHRDMWKKNFETEKQLRRKANGAIRQARYWKKRYQTLLDQV